MRDNGKSAVFTAEGDILEKVSSLFLGWEETMVYSCVSGIMGKVLTVGGGLSAAAAIGDFCFLAGEPDRALITHDYGRDFLIMVPRDEKWESLIEEFLPSARRHIRYSIKKEHDCFDRQKLDGIISSLPEDFTLRQIDEELYNKCLKASWCSDFVCNYASFEEYGRIGLGFAVLHGGEIAAGASSHTSYDGGIEIEIATREDFRRLGLASVCGAALICGCLDRGIYPSWDAHDMRSVKLAEKLGYHMDRPYPVYILEK